MLIKNQWHHRRHNLLINNHWHHRRYNLIINSDLYCSWLNYTWIWYFWSYFVNIFHRSLENQDKDICYDVSIKSIWPDSLTCVFLCFKFLLSHSFFFFLSFLFSHMNKEVFHIMILLMQIKRNQPNKCWIKRIQNRTSIHKRFYCSWLTNKYRAVWCGLCVKKWLWMCGPEMSEYRSLFWLDISITLTLNKN